MMKVFEVAAGLLGDVISRDSQELNEDVMLCIENDIDSIDIARFAIACEETFGLVLHDEKIAAWQTLGDACTHIEKLLEDGQAERTERTEEERIGWFYEYSRST